MKAETLNKNDLIEGERAAAIAIVDADYYDRKSKHYKDNDRYRWAINAINKKFNEKLNPQ